MAILDNKKKVRGSIGPLTYRVVGSKNIVQSRPGKGGVKQTQATKTCSSEFGVASNTARAIRQIFYPAYHKLNDSGMINRLTSSVLKAIKGNKEKDCGERDLHGGDLRYLDNFQFNINSPLDEILQVHPLVQLSQERKLTVKLPAFDVYKKLKTPRDSSLSTIRILVVAFNFQEEYHEYCGLHEIEINRGKKQQEAVEWICPELVPAGCIILVSMSVHFSNNPYNMGTVVLNSKAMQPAAIIGAFETTEDEAGKAAITSDEVKASKKLAEGEIPLNYKMSLSGYWGNDLLDRQKRRKRAK